MIITVLHYYKKRLLPDRDERKIKHFTFNLKVNDKTIRPKAETGSMSSSIYGLCLHIESDITYHLPKSRPETRHR